MKSKGVAAVLALFLGGLGVHKFYLNRAVPGVFYLLFCWTFIPSILALIDCIILLVMSQQEFDSKYNLHELLRNNQPQQISQNIVIQQAPAAAAAPVQVPQGRSGGSMAEELQKLNELRVSGVLTEEEFVAHKQKLLSA